MISDPIERLRAANPEPWCPPPSIDEVWRRIQTRDLAGHGRAAPGPGGLAAIRARLRSTAGVLALLSSVAIVIAVGAIALLSHGRGTPAGSSGGARQLIAKLAVLRRPQAAADLLPSDLHITSPLSPQGKIIPRFTRLVRTLPDARLYVVVTTWSPDSTWSQRLGDQVAILDIGGGHATESMPIPAADLTNANEVRYLTPTSYVPRSSTESGAYLVGIVPDGVARVRWTFAKTQSKPGAVLTVPVADNVAVARARPDTAPPVLRAVWYAPDGQRVASSDRALLAAQAARDAAQKAQAIRYDLQYAHHANPYLLGAFAVFAITSPTGVKSAAGDIISRPPLSSLPLDVVQWAPGPLQRFQLDFTQVREVITPAGAHLYVIPGRQGLCLVSDGGTSCGLLPQVASQGIYMTGGSLGISRTYRILPKTFHSITIPTSRGRGTIPVPDGIYVSPRQRDRQLRRLVCGTGRQAPTAVPQRCHSSAR